MRVDPRSNSVFVSDAAAKPGDLPAFAFGIWTEGLLAKLPPPAAAFGLALVEGPLAAPAEVARTKERGAAVQRQAMRRQFAAPGILIPSVPVLKAVPRRDL
jgi:hypothetical protein